MEFSREREGKGREQTLLAPYDNFLGTGNTTISSSLQVVKNKFLKS
jgi:hypothetical protein